MRADSTGRRVRVNVQFDVVTTQPDTSNRDAQRDDIVGRLVDGRYKVVS